MGEIRRQGTVVQVTDKEIVVEVCRESACSACSARVVCSGGGSGESSGHRMTLIDDGMGRQVGDRVVVLVSESRAALAVVLAYLVPVFVIIGLLLVFREVGVSESVSGMLVLVVLAVYFLLLRVLDKQIAEKLTITIE